MDRRTARRVSLTVVAALIPVFLVALNEFLGPTAVGVAVFGAALGAFVWFHPGWED